jgi:hypothetical protein
MHRLNFDSRVFPQSPEYVSREDLRRYAHRGILGRTLRLKLRHQQRRVTYLWYALRCAYRSYRGHMALLRARGELVVDFGQALLLSNGHLIRNTRTDTRSLGARTMLTSRPWANTTDVLSYLEGFDAGERYAASIFGTQGHTTPQDLTCETPAL